MDFISLEFLSALAAIVVIDLVLAGDNAIVIAMAARSVAPQLRRRAIIWGSVGAVVARIAMTLAVVWLLAIPGLMLAGGLLLVWIAWKLLLPEDKPADAGGSAASGFAAAVRTIITADVVMGVDNVVAVAGAAHGSFTLVVIGLVISIPIVVWGSSLLLGFIERYPAIIYIGAAVLAFTAAKMMLGEPVLQEPLAALPWVAWLMYAVVIGGVLWTGYLARQRSVAVHQPG